MDDAAVALNLNRRVDRRQQLEPRPVRRRTLPLKEPDLREQKRTGADRCHLTGTGSRVADPGEHCFVLQERASVDKPRLALLADRVARPFLWFVLLASGAAAAFWWSTDPAKALMAAVAVLVVTCPCALSLATPTAMLTSAGALARRGLLVRRLQALESLGIIDTVIFDKTGTLTEDRLGLQAVTTREGVSATQALQLACALAQYSLHPASCALVRAAGDLPMDAGESSLTPSVVDVSECAGLGLEGTFLVSPVPGYAGRMRLGSARFCGLEPSRHDVLQVCLADDSGWIARFELDEVVRPDAAAAVAAFHSAGIDVKLLSGDRDAAARHEVDHRPLIRSCRATARPRTNCCNCRPCSSKGARC